MGNETEHRQVEDPFANYSGLSLFRSTFSLPSSKPYDDLDAIHSILRSMDLGSSAKLVEQRKSVLECNLGFNTGNSTKDIGDDAVFAAEENDEFHRKKRGPDLGLNRTRPRFSLKETKKPSVEDLLPVLDFKNIKDPNELFMAHERLEKARKEIEKQLGIVPSQSTLDSTKLRERRPGLPGFNPRPIKFRNRFSVETLDSNADALLSQEAFESDSLDPVGDNADKGKASLASLDSEVTSSSAVKEKKVNVNDFLKGLLTRDSEELEGVGAMDRLQERLQIKPIVVEKPSVPDFPDSQPMDLKSSHGNLSQPSKACYDISNLLKGIDIKTPLRQDVGCPENQLASPTPPRSPVVLFSTLQKHISQSKPSGNPFSAHEIDLESTKESSPTHMVNQEVNIVCSSKLSDEPGAPIIEDVIAADETNKILDTSAQSKEDNSRKLSEQLNASSMEYEVAVSETCSVDDPIRNCISTPKKSTVDNSREPGFNANVDSNEPPVDMEIGGSGVGKRVMDDIAGKQNVEPNEPDQFEDEMLAENMQETSDFIPTDDLNSNLGIPLADQSNPDAHEDNSTDNSARRSDDGQEQSSQEKTVGSVAPVSGKKRVKMCAKKASKGKRFRLRNSLANVDSNEPPVDMEIGGSGVGKRVMDDIAGKQNVEPNEPDQFEDEMLAENMQETSDFIPTDDLNSNLGIPLADQSNPDAHEDNSTDNSASRSDDGQEQSSQEKTVGSVAPVSGKKRVKMCAKKASKGKRFRLRNSLANVDSNEPPVDMEIGGSGVGKRVMDDIAGKQNVEPNEPDQFEDEMLAENMQETSDFIPTDDLNSNLGIPLADQSNPDAHEDNSTDNSARRSDDGQEQSSQEKTVGSVAPVSGKKRVKMCAKKASNGKRFRLRNSLANVDSNEPPVDMEIGGSGVGKRVMDDIAGKQNVEPNEPDQFEDEMLAENMQETSDFIPTDDLNSNLGIPLADQSNPDAHEDNSTDNSARRSDDGQEQSSQEKTVGSVAPVSGKKRVKMCAKKASKGKRFRLRNSLANVDSNEPPVDMEIGGSGVGKRVMDDIAGKQNVEPNEPDQFEDEMLAENMQETSDFIPTDDLNSNLGIPLADQSNPDAHEDNSTDNSARRSDDGQEQSSQEKTVGSVAPVSGKKRVKMCAKKASKGKRFRLRNSLANVDSNEPPVDMEIGGSGVGKRVMADIAGKPNVEPNEPDQFEDEMLAENMQETSDFIPTDDLNSNLGIPLADQSNPDAHEDNSTDNSARRSDDGQEQSSQEKTVGSVAPVSGKKRVKMRAQKASKGKRFRLRSSLACAGTSWESGVRRSSRFRTRPLEFWKGERMVYGRVHESLTTVIGVKRLSLGTDGKPIMKAQSFVSDKHKKLFELASRY